MLLQNTGVHVHFRDSREKHGYDWQCRVLVISSRSYLLLRLLTGDKMGSSQPATAPLPAAFQLRPLRAPIKKKKKKTVLTKYPGDPPGSQPEESYGCHKTVQGR